MEELRLRSRSHGEPLRYRHARTHGRREIVGPTVGMDRNASMKAVHWHGSIQPEPAPPATDFVSFFVHAGGAEVRRVSRRSETATAGCVIVPALREFEAWESDGEFDWYQLYVSKRLFDETALERFGDAPLTVLRDDCSVSRNPQMRGVALSVIKELFSLPPSDLQLDVSALRLTEAWLRDSAAVSDNHLDYTGPPKGARKSKAVMRAIEFAESNLDRNVSLEEMAAAAEVSRFHLVRLFREFLGHSPAKYSRARRVERSKTLLRESRLSLAEISMQCGFYDQSHFTKTFSEYTGVTPLEFRSRS